MSAFFSPTLFRRNLSRFWPLSVVCLIAAFFAFVAPAMAGQDYAFYRGAVVTPTALYAAMFVPFSSAFAALSAFGYLHNGRAAGFVSALPVSRRGLYITSWLSGLTLILAPTLVAGLFYGVALSGQGAGGEYLIWLGVMVAAHLFFFSLAVLSAFLTGNPFMQVFLYGLINFLYGIFYLIVVGLSEMMVYGYNGSLPYLDWLTPPIAMVSWLRPLYLDAPMQALAAWAGYLAVAAAAAVGGYFLYKKRPIESAGDVLVHHKLRPVFRYIIAFIVGIALGVLFVAITGNLYGARTSAMAPLALASAFFGALACLFIEMLYQKRVRVLGAAWKHMAIFAAAIAVLALGLRFDITGFEGRMPAERDVVAVSFSRGAAERLLFEGEGSTSAYYLAGPNWALSEAYINSRRAAGQPVLDAAILEEIKARREDYFESPEAIAQALALHRALIDDKAALEALEGTSGTTSHTLTYKLRDGRVFSRRYLLPDADETLASIQAAVALHNAPEATAKRLRFRDLPESAIVAAFVQSGTDRYIDTYVDYEKYMGAPNESMLLEGDALGAVMQALRADADSGALGMMSLSEIKGWTETGCTLSLYYDPALFPGALMPDEIYLGEQVIRGMRIGLNIPPRCANTWAVLTALGLTADIQ